MASKKAGLPIKKAEGSGKVDAANPTIRPSQQDVERERRWKAESALETISKAEEHKRDRDLMRDVKSLAKSKIKSMQKIC